MTLTKKIGTLLLLLTLGSLAGIGTFALFFVRTAGDGVYLVATQISQGMLQRMQLDMMLVRDGEDGRRSALGNTIEKFDVLVAAMEEGSREPSSRPVALLNRIITPNIRADDEAILQMTDDLSRSLPPPPDDLRIEIVRMRQMWLTVRTRLQTIAVMPAGDPEAQAAYAWVRPELSELERASRRTLLRVGDRISAQRLMQLGILAGTGVFSVAMFGIGLWVTKQHIARPVELIEKASRGIRAGDFSQRVPIVSNDEVAALALTFNEMCTEIERLVDRYRELFENASDVVYTMDLEGKFLSVNRTAERVSGYDRSELLNMKIEQVVPPGQLAISREMLDRKVSGGVQTTVYPAQILTKDGRTVSVEVSTRLIYENGKPVAVHGMARDITERRRLEEQLWVAQKMEAVGRLAGGVAHEFGNVLTIISGYCALMSSSVKEGDPLRDGIAGIQRASQRATSLIRHLLGFSRGQVFRPRILNIREALDGAAEMLRLLLGEDITLTVRCAPDVGPLRVDTTQFELIMVNLALNARDAMPKGGTLSIEAENASDGRWVRLRFADEGCGIKPDVLPKIFEPFFSTKEHGTGLGLSTVYGIVRNYAGSISVDTVVEGGTTFTIFLPRAEAVPESEEPEPAALDRATHGKETILLVEDDEDVRALVCKMLRKNGYSVIQARDQQEAVAMCSDRGLRIDLMLTDVVMPGTSGPALASLVRPLRPELKIVYMSGYANDKSRGCAPNNEPFHFIQKPLTPDCLAARIREVLDSAG